ncbi:hypothetical protein HAZT_HAZT004375 [Hyalella azteca]|uniref:UBC core domain-containing protein n=1 Tax=Hyalella azteca TaxID=294128 RepID=A0A6A0HBM8_HYAAZ|nr:hypothetical protein HAZT_HAZT004375 [Hyalella azteca]
MNDNAASNLVEIRDSRDKECEFRRYDFYPGQVLVGNVQDFETVEWVECSDAVTAKLQATETRNRRSKMHVTVQKVEVANLVNVWWVDGSSSVCFPQDLYKVGEYDSDEGELWDDDDGDSSLGSDDGDDKSWRTATDDEDEGKDGPQGGDVSDDSSQGSWVDDKSPMLKTRLVANIEKARVVMGRLEEIFTQNPGLQSTQVMKQLLDCYKECRYMDKLMSTRFFHESNFAGLIEKVRERGCLSTNQKMAEQVQRLFNGSPYNADRSKLSKNKPVSGGAIVDNSTHESTISTETAVSDVSCINPKNIATDLPVEITETTVKTASAKKDRPKDGNVREDCNTSGRTSSKSSSRSIGGSGALLKRLSDSDMLIHHHAGLENKSKRPVTSHIKDSKSCNDIKNSSIKTPKEGNENVSTEEVSIKGDGLPPSEEAHGADASSICTVLCSMMKVQLLKTYEEVVSRYGGHFDMSNIQSELKQEAGPEETLSIDQKELIASCVEAIRVELLRPHDEADITERNLSIAETLPNLGILSTKISLSTVSSAKSQSTIPCDALETKEKSGLVDHISSDLPSNSDCGSFTLLETAPDTHKFKLTMLQPSQPSLFYKTVKNEIRLLQSSLPGGIWVRGYQDRMDLYSVMIRGPAKTPYQDGLFFFDFQLSADYPHAPPLCNYVPYCSDRLNPNLYEDGKVCISLLGTWSGKGTEVWTHRSNLLQVIVSIQGLILVSEPYFNEAGYERQKGSQQGHENSRMYNEMVLLKLIQATARMLQNPPSVFKEEILEHFNANAGNLISRLERWLNVSEGHNAAHPLSPTTPNTYRSIVTDKEQQAVLPEFPLIPASKGFCLTLRTTLPQVKAIFDKVLAEGWNAVSSRPTNDVSSCEIKAETADDTKDCRTTGAIRKTKLRRSSACSDGEIPNCGSSSPEMCPYVETPAFAAGSSVESDNPSALSAHPSLTSVNPSVESADPLVDCTDLSIESNDVSSELTDKNCCGGASVTDNVSHNSSDSGIGGSDSASLPVNDTNSSSKLEQGTLFIKSNSSFCKSS